MDPGVILSVSIKCVSEHKARGDTGICGLGNACADMAPSAGNVFRLYATFSGLQNNFSEFASLWWNGKKKATDRRGHMQVREASDLATLTRYH